MGRVWLEASTLAHGERTVLLVRPVDSDLEQNPTSILRHVLISVS